MLNQSEADSIDFEKAYATRESFGDYRQDDTQKYLDELHN